MLEKENIMKDRIGETAGQIWKIMRKNEEVNIAQLPKLLEEKSAIVYQALGWLARENKIAYRMEGTKTFVSLTDVERNK
jgi:hypothetical protein